MATGECMDLDDFTAEQLMTKNPASIRVTATARRALALLHELDVRHLPVVNDDNELVGMLSDRDFARTTNLDGRVGDLMSSNVLSLTLDSELTDILELMLTHKIGALPVINGDNALVGIVSYIDVLRELHRTLK
jgi:acetoin utilization protein AcuB